MNTSLCTASVIALLTVLGGAGCLNGGVALITEARAIELARGVLADRGIQATDLTHVLSGLEVCDDAQPAPACETVSFTLDGWDPARRVGFEYVSDNDPDFGRGTRWSDSGDIAFLQSAVDASVAASGDVVLMIRQWAHETEGLAEDQLVGQLEVRLDALGL